MSQNKTISMTLKEDSLQRMSRSSPVQAIIELIKNSLDAEATYVEISVHSYCDGAFPYYEIKDNGTGVPFDKAEKYFGQIGNSWKSYTDRTPILQRQLLGSKGEGRLKSASIGECIKWESTYKNDKNEYLTFTISWLAKTAVVNISEPQKAHTNQTGVTCTISQIKKPLVWLEPNKTGTEKQRLCESFLTYMSKYPNIQIKFPFGFLDPRALLEKETSFEMQNINWNGKLYNGKLTLKEWRGQITAQRLLYWLDTKGNIVHDEKILLQVPGLNFSADFQSKLVDEAEDTIICSDGDGNKESLLDMIKTKIKAYYIHKKAFEAQESVQKWKKDGIYPYEDIDEDRITPIEKTERNVFDIVAYKLEECVADLKKSSTQQKRLQFGLLKIAIANGTEELNKILIEVLKLSKSKQKEFANILSSISLDSMIEVSGIIKNRIEFLKALKSFVFDEEYKSKLKERSQLHKLVENNTWIFGEGYTLTNSDESIAKALREHRKLLQDGESEEENIAINDSPVRTIGGKQAILDLFLSRRIPTPANADLQHLVIELKRPNVKIGTKEIAQIKTYANAIAADARFDQQRTNWNFWVVSTGTTKEADFDRESSDRPFGVIGKSKSGKITIWLKTWSEILSEADDRMDTYIKALNGEPSVEQAVRDINEQYKGIFDVDYASQQEGKTKRRKRTKHTT